MIVQICRLLRLPHESARKPESGATTIVRTNMATLIPINQVTMLQLRGPEPDEESLM